MISFALGKGMPDFQPEPGTIRQNAFATQWQYTLTQWQRLGSIKCGAARGPGNIEYHQSIVLKGQYKRVKNKK